jgi:hypothetical protein
MFVLQCALCLYIAAVYGPSGNSMALQCGMLHVSVLSVWLSELLQMELLVRTVSAYTPRSMCLGCKYEL